MDQHALECLQEKARRNLRTYFTRGVFSAASLAVATRDSSGYTDCFFNLGSTGDNEEYQVEKNTFFDLASLTKPLATLPSILHLIDKGKISWHEQLDSLLQRPVAAHFRQIELHTLLSHCSGFTAHRNYWKELKYIEQGRKKEWLVDNILETTLEYKTGSRHLYSDVGYLLLGIVVKVKSGLELDEYWKLHIAGPAGINEKLLFGPLTLKNYNAGRVVSTGYCSWSRKPLTGLVHDDNCRALGGVAGHAGLFGSAEGVLELCKQFLELYHTRRSTLPLSAHTFKRAAVRVGNSDWSCGFSLPSTAGSSSGTLFSETSLGHLGFTGVSFWIDVDRQIIVSLLTNRVRQGEDMNGIREARPALHDVVMGCLTGEKSPPLLPGDV